MLEYYNHFRGQRLRCNRKVAISILSEYYGKVVHVTQDLGMTICDYDRAEKELKRIQRELQRNPYRVIIVGDLEVRKEVKEG